MIPPKNLKDPVRVGQASNSSALVKLLERYRNVPEKRRQKFLESIGRFKDKTVICEEDKDKIYEILERARQLSEVDFELQKEELAKELAVFNKD